MKKLTQVDIAASLIGLLARSRFFRPHERPSPKKHDPHTGECTIAPQSSARPSSLRKLMRAVARGKHTVKIADEKTRMKHASYRADKARKDRLKAIAEGRP